MSSLGIQPIRLGVSSVADENRSRLARRADVLPAAVYLNSRDFEDGEPPERWVSAELDDALASVVALACARSATAGHSSRGRSAHDSPGEPHALAFGASR